MFQVGEIVEVPLVENKFIYLKCRLRPRDSFADSEVLKYSILDTCQGEIRFIYKNHIRQFEIYVPKPIGHLIPYYNGNGFSFKDLQFNKWICTKNDILKLKDQIL